MNKKMLEIAKNIISMSLISRDGENCWKVDEQIVINKTNKGSSSLSCSCQNSSLYPTADCQHKICVILFESQGKFYQTMDAVINQYERFKKINVSPDIQAFIEQLKLLKYTK